MKTTEIKREVRKGLKRLEKQKNIAKRLGLSEAQVSAIKKELEKRAPVRKQL